MLRTVDRFVLSALRSAIWSVGSRGEIFATHFPVNMLLMLIDPGVSANSFFFFFATRNVSYNSVIEIAELQNKQKMSDDLFCSSGVD